MLRDREALGTGARLAALLGTALLVFGCTPRPLVELYHVGTGQVTVMTESVEPSCRASAGTRCPFWFAPEIRVTVDGVVRVYRFPPRLRFEDSPEYVETRFPSRRVLKMQLDEAGLIWLLPADATGPAGRVTTRQLPGFPVAPQASTSFVVGSRTRG